MWAPFTGSDGDVLREIIDNYNETNTDNITVQIDIMDNDTLQTKFATAVSTGTGPSFVLVGIEYLHQYEENGLIEDISDFWDTMGIDKSNFYENVLAKSYIDDALYGVPMQYNVQYLYYNKDLFTEAGLDPENPPTTLDELREAAIACTDPSKNQSKGWRRAVKARFSGRFVPRRRALRRAAVRLTEGFSCADGSRFVPDKDRKKEIFPASSLFPAPAEIL